ncbi:MAG: hypothetical protein U1E78_09400 [Gammaproteobacteria bacterium]
MIFRVGAERSRRRSVHKVHDCGENREGNNPENSGVKGIQKALGLYSNYTNSSDVSVGAMTPFEWLHKFAAEQNKKNLLHAPQFESSRILLFTASKLSVMPDEDLGGNAKEFMRIAQQYYTMGDWSPPLSLTKVFDIYRTFSEIDFDLTNDPNWNTFWEEYFKNLTSQKLSETESNRLQFLISNAKTQLLTGYRYKVISVTDFLPAEVGESRAEQALKEIRCRSFFQQINRYRRELSAEECYYRLIDIFEKNLINEIEAASATFEIQFKGSKKIEQSVTFLEMALLQIKSKLEFEFLGEKAHFLIKPLEDIVNECLRMRQLIDQSLENICHEASPGVDARILIDLEMPTIERSAVYQNLSEIGARFTSRYLTSSHVLKEVHDKVMQTRVDVIKAYFNDQPPFHKVQEKIDRVTSLSGKRTLLELLFVEFLQDKINFPDPAHYLRWFGVTLTPKQKKFQTMFQKQYLTALKREYNEISQTLAMQHLKESVSKAILAPLGKASIFDTRDDSVQNELKDFIEHPPERKSLMGETLNLFDPFTPMEIDITIGLHNQLDAVLRYVKSTSVVSIASVHQTYEASQDFTKLVSGEIDALQLSKALRQITDLEQRKKTILDLFQFVISKPNTHPEDCVPVLQELFINAVKEEVRRLNPKNLDEKNTAYQTLLAPAKASPLLRYGDEKTTHSLFHKLDALIERISI